MSKMLLIKYSEIGVKGNNRYVFEDMLVRNIKSALRVLEHPFSVRKAQGRIYVTHEEVDYDEAVAALTKVFGIAWICPVTQIEPAGIVELKRQVVRFMKDTYFSEEDSGSAAADSAYAAAGAEYASTEADDAAPYAEYASSCAENTSSYTENTSTDADNAAPCAEYASTGGTQSAVADADNAAAGTESDEKESGNIVTGSEESAADSKPQGKTYTFKVNCRRAEKSYPMTSMEINMEIGEALLEQFPELKVDVHHPDIMLNIEIRPRDINIYSVAIEGLNGMPVGSSGKAMLLLSGGIDSPVAGYLVSRRGVSLDAVYFHAPPYTSERAKQKVVDLARIISRYAGPIRLHVVNFTDIQMKIYETCPHEELTIIMRRYMMRIAQELAEKQGALGLVTGESIGQVASQTMQSMLVTNEVCTMPVYRPLCAFDKLDIVAISEKIDAYETSILPYEDCCTIFVAKHPVTKPRLEKILKSERKLEGSMEELYRQAVDTVEIIDI